MSIFSCSQRKPFDFPAKTKLLGIVIAIPNSSFRYFSNSEFRFCAFANRKTARSFWLNNSFIAPRCFAKTPKKAVCTFSVSLALFQVIWYNHAL